MSRLASKPARFTLDEFMRMSDAGVLGEKRFELLAGRIIRMAPQQDPHMWAITRISRLLIAATTAKDGLIIQGTLVLPPSTAVEPDFQLFDVPEGTPADKRPLPILVIEVSHKTYRRDSGSKLRTYAQAGVQDYWIVNLRDHRVEVYRQPKRPSAGADCGYALKDLFTRGDFIPLLKRPDLKLSVADMLP